MSKNQQLPSSSLFSSAPSSPFSLTEPENPDSGSNAEPTETAFVYCEGHFGTNQGSIANDLVRCSLKYKIISVIDSDKSGEDSGQVLEGTANGIPIYRDLGTALAHAGGAPKLLILGVTPADGILSPAERQLVLRAMKYKINIASALDASLNADPELSAACVAFGTAIRAL